MKYLLFSSVVLILTLFSCKKEIPQNDEINSEIQFTEKSNGVNGISEDSDGFVFEVDQPEEFFIDKVETEFSAYKMTCVLSADGILSITREEIFMDINQEEALGENMILSPVKLTPHGSDGYKAHFKNKVIPTLQFIPFNPDDGVIEAYTGGTPNTLITCTCVNTAPSEANDCSPKKVLNISTGKISTKCRGCAKCASNERTFQARLIVDTNNGNGTAIQAIELLN